MQQGEASGTIDKPATSRPLFVNLRSGPKLIVPPKPRKPRGDFERKLSRSRSLDEYEGTPGFKVVGTTPTRRRTVDAEEVLTDSQPREIPREHLSEARRIEHYDPEIVENIILTTPLIGNQSQSSTSPEEFFDTPELFHGPSVTTLISAWNQVD